MISAAVLLKKNKLKVYSNIKLPKLDYNQVLVKIVYSGICGSQLFEINGLRGKDKFLPHLLGHEGTGIVKDIGKNVKNVKKGDKVFLSWIKDNKKDAKKPKYIKNGKIINAGNITTLSNMSIISSNRVFKLPKKIDFKTGVLLGCALPTGAGIVINNKSKNNKILIIGLGGVGLSALLGSLYMKLKHIDVLEKNSSKVNHIKKYIKFKNINYYEKNHFLKKNSYDLVIETSGNAKMISKSMDLIKISGKVIFASHPKFRSKISLNPFDLISGKRIFGTWGGEIKFSKDLRILIKIIKKFKNLNKIFFNKSYKLTQINSAIDDFAKGRVIRPLIKF